MEIHDYASYDGAEVMHYMGFARPLDEIPMLLQPGVLSIAWGTAIRQLAAGLGIEVHAGHGLNYHNVQPVAAIRDVVELNIGHAIIARALFDGLPVAVREMKRLMAAARA